MVMVSVVVERFDNFGSGEHIVSALTQACSHKGACTTLDSVLGIAATESRYDLLPHGRIGLDPLP